MKKQRLILVLMLLMIGLVGCQGTETTVSNEPTEIETEVEPSDEPNETSPEMDTTEELAEEKDVEEEVVKEGTPSPLSGLYGPEEKINRRPVAIMFDNYKTARWQAGLSQAEIVYEVLVEGKITRYMGLFLMNDPKHIGSIRSARPYFISKMLEYDAMYVHDGGSPQAKADIKSLKVADVDAYYSTSHYFWRYNETGKKRPHNEYTSMDRIREYGEKRGYRSQGDFVPFKFNEEDKAIEGTPAQSVTIKYFNNNTTEYNYDAEKKVYTRKKDGKLHIDEVDEKPIVAKNILIQEARTVVIDSVGRLDIDIIGKGKGKFITNGQAIDVTWEKKDRRSKTIYYDASGEEIVLNPGVTWIQVTPIDPNVTIQ